FVSSFFGGNPRKVVDLWKNGSIFICLSPEIVDEYVAVLKRLGVDEPHLKELFSLFSRGYQILFTSETPRLRIVSKDPSDDKFIECAVALEANYIISGDKALLEIGKYMGIEILSPKRFLSRYTEQ
ncbi:MAG: putative toxin-antitoxin system toxin component, PIN family, partial [Deltaproteobacteria bacterium]|nr:putative toxin-antitoxin system toxin component, PIN family [Deltaproteobacteria bacterium]